VKEKELNLGDFPEGLYRIEHEVGEEGGEATSRITPLKVTVPQFERFMIEVDEERDAELKKMLQAAPEVEPTEKPGPPPEPRHPLSGGVDGGGETHGEKETL
jgi:hypothetical protein